jgi:branched-chain amino acid transport system ATP-binding protein
MLQAEASAQAPRVMLETRGLSAGYGDLAAIRDVSLEIRAGEIVALFGANGAGKSTTLLSIVGELPRMSGAVLWRGNPASTRLHELARQGLMFVPGEAPVLFSMTVRDNLLLAKGGLDVALDLFPVLKPLLGRKAGLLSGGEQRILALARALSLKPSVLLLDELSMGLAPVIVEHLYSALQAAVSSRDVGVLLVEQEVRRALRIADRWYLLRNGNIVSDGNAATDPARLEAEYLTGLPSLPENEGTE